MEVVSQKQQTQIDTIIDKYQASPSSLLAIMQDIQDEARYLSKDAIMRVAERLKIPVASIYQMATFFESFHLKPRGEHVFTVCMGTACHVRGAQKLVDHLEREFDISSGGTTKDQAFSIEEVNCVGACALGPLVMVNGKYHRNMTTGSLQKTVGQCKKDNSKDEQGEA